MSKINSTHPSKAHMWTFGLMLACGIIGLIVSFILSVEKIHLLEQPNATLSCSFNLVLNCSTVMQTWQSSVFGFPNMYIGLMAFPVVITVAVVALTGATLPRWFWRAAHVCYGLGLLFAYWLFFNSVYDIQVLCPWCLVITFTMTILFEVMNRYVFRQNIWGLSSEANNRVQAFLDRDFDKLLVASWIVLLTGLVFVQFGSGLFA
jgi:uncharacterized membrane protein